MVDRHEQAAMGGGSGEQRHLREPLEAYLRSKGKGDDGRSGNYRRNAERVIERFVSWVEASPRDEPSFDALDPRTFRRWIRDDLVADDDLSARTVETYYNYVSAYVGWCVREGVLEENLARRREAEEELPTTAEVRVGQQQSWRREHRRQLRRHCDRVADQALDGADDPIEALKPLRDRALVAVLAFAGVRGAEVLADPNDDRRDGATWGDVAYDRQAIRVLSKKQELDDRPLLPQSIPPLQQLERVLDPREDWPLFPTLHWGRLYDGLRTTLRADGWPSAEVEALLDDCDGRRDVFEAYRDHGARPPALRTDGARDLLRSLTDAAGIELDDKHGYLAPHGARRGVGEVLVKERGFDEAADQLDNEASTTQRYYAELTARERSEDRGRAFEAHDTGGEE